MSGPIAVGRILARAAPAANDASELFEARRVAEPRASCRQPADPRDTAHQQEFAGRPRLSRSEPAEQSAIAAEGQSHPVRHWVRSPGNCPAPFAIGAPP